MIMATTTKYAAGVMRGQACLKVMRHKVALLRLLRAGWDFDTLHLCARLGMLCLRVMVVEHRQLWRRSKIDGA